MWIEKRVSNPLFVYILNKGFKTIITDNIKYKKLFAFFSVRFCSIVFCIVGGALGGADLSGPLNSIRTG